MNDVLQNAVIIAMLLAIIVVPVIFASRRMKNRRRKTIGLQLQQLADEHELDIQRSEFLGDRAIGLDPAAGKLLYIDARSGDNAQVVRLAQPVKSWVNKHSREGTVDLVSLEIRNAAGETASLVFYKQFTDNEMRLMQFILQANRWQQEIDEHWGPR